MRLFYDDMCPPARAVLLAAKALGLQSPPLEMKPVHIYDVRRDQLDAELAQINPQHTVPTLCDGDFTIWDSHAIIGYLVSKYGDSDDLYPNEPRRRALVDQKLHFDSGVLFPRVNSILTSIVVENEKQIPSEKISAIIEAYTFLEDFLKNQKYLAGDTLTVADLCCVATISTATIVTPIATELYPNLSTWYRTCKSLPYYDEANAVGLNKLDALVELKLGRPRIKELCE